MLRGNRTRERKIQPAAVLLDGSLNTIKLNILLVKLDDARVTLCRNAAIRRCYTNLTVARARENPTRAETLPYRMGHHGPVGKAVFLHGSDFLNADRLHCKNGGKGNW